MGLGAILSQQNTEQTQLAKTCISLTYPYEVTKLLLSSDWKASYYFCKGNSIKIWSYKQ